MALDFPSPSTTAEVSTGDITWKWNGYAWYATTDATQIIHVGVSAPPSPRLGQMWWCSATTDEGGGRLYVYFDDVWVDASLPGGGQGGDFLSKTEDDTAAGQITFEGKTTHEAGVNVTNGNIRTNEGGILSFLTTGSTNVNVAPGVATLTNYTGYSSGGNASATINGVLKGYEALGTLQGTPGTRTGTYGFYSAVQSEDNAYNFYAAGSAPNYFAGKIIGPSGANFGEGNPGLEITDDKSGVIIGNVSHVIARADDTSNPALFFNRNSTNAKPQFIRFGRGDGSKYNAQGFIRQNGSNSANSTGIEYCVNSSGATAFVEIGDLRSRSYTDFQSSASDVIKLLQPKRDGFVPHVLAQHVAEAVTGTQNETEAVGTYTDSDGNVETEIPEPEAIPFGATWEQTGTRDVYQGVDQTKLIPILTKALQEALTRIEALESNEVVDDATDSALLTLVANLSTRVTALEGA